MFLMITQLKKYPLLAFVCLLAMPFVGQADDTETLQRGEKVFQEIAGLGCKSCHGEYAEGDLGVGPYIRGATEGTIRAAIEGIDAMIVIKSTIDEQSIKDVVAYIGSLGSTAIIRTLSKKGRFLPESLSVPPNSNFQIVINNSSFQAKTFKSVDLGPGMADGIEIPARKTGGITWQSPEQGEFKLHCDNCKLADQFFTITVDPNAPATGNAAAAVGETSQEDSEM